MLGVIFLGLILLGAGSLLNSTPVAAQSTTTGKEVVIADFNLPVDAGSAAFMSRVVSTAQSDNAAAIVIQMNTPGGSVSDILDIIASITKANQTGIPTYTFIVPNGAGASAGSYIAMATNKILMGPGSAIGPSTPIVVGGTPLEQNHTQAYFLSYMQSLAQNWGRNTTAVYYMVQADQAYSANEAVAYNVADGIATSLSDALNQLGLSQNPQVTLSESFSEQVLSVLSNATLDGILILVGIIAIVIDIYHPTIVLSIVGIIAIALGLVGAEIIGASLLGIIILIIAAVLIIAEIKLGHGIAFMGGVILGVVGIYFLSYDLPYSPSPITGLTELALVLLVVFGVIVGLYLRWIIGPLRRRKKLTGAESMIGKPAVAITDLKPKGEVRVVGEIWRAQSTSGDIAKGEQVTVKALEGLVVIVEKPQLKEENNDTKNK